jgi:formate dehydrogenase maturation protein FdhE
MNEELKTKNLQLFENIEKKLPILFDKFLCSNYLNFSKRIFHMLSPAKKNKTNPTITKLKISTSNTMNHFTSAEHPRNPADKRRIQRFGSGLVIC